MSIADHTAILLFSALATPEKNKLKLPDAPAEYYAVVAFDPAAAGDLAAAMQAVSPTGTLDGFELAPKRNAANAKPYAGIPDDWITLRMSSQFAPEIYAESGEAIAASPLSATRVKTEFFSGQRVRVNAEPFAWHHKQTNRRGISMGLRGIMAAGGGVARAGGQSSATVFGIVPGAAPAEAPAPAAPAPAASGNPFQVGSPKANPFG